VLEQDALQGADRIVKTGQTESDAVLLQTVCDRTCSEARFLCLTCTTQQMTCELG
jgi:hypothetical protein